LYLQATTEEGFRREMAQQSDTPMIRRILVPSDGSEGAMAAARYAARLATHFGASVTVLHVVEMPRIPDYFFRMKESEIRDEFIEGGKAVLGLTQKVFIQAGIPTEMELRQGRAGDVISQVASEGGFDLIVIGSRGVGMAESMLLGSVSEQVVRKASRPVLVVRGDVQAR
jgi:nucleotide-binding universal stress UspA family protein